MLQISRVLEMEGQTIWDSFKYLGIPIFKVGPKATHWFPLLDKMKERINAWGASSLNLAGKIVLLDFVLANIPIFQNSY